MSDDADKPYHFTPDQAAVVGRDPAGTGQFGPPAGPPTPGRHAVYIGPGQGVPAEVAEVTTPAAPELRELPAGLKTDEAVIYVPQKDGIMIGQLVIDALGVSGQQFGPGGMAFHLNVVDPRGVRWVDGESNDYWQDLLDAFLDQHEDRWLPFRNPIDGYCGALSQLAAARVLAVLTAWANVKEPPVPAATPAGVRIVRGSPPFPFNS